MSVLMRAVLLLGVAMGFGFDAFGQVRPDNDGRSEQKLSEACGYTLDVSKLPKSILASVIEILPGDISSSDSREIKETIEAISRAKGAPDRRDRLEARLQRVKNEAEQNRPTLIRMRGFIPAKAVGLYAWAEDGRWMILPQKQPPTNFAAVDFAIIMQAMALKKITTGDLVRVRARSWEVSPDEIRIIDLLSSGSFNRYVPKLAALATRAAIAPAGSKDLQPATYAPLLVRDAKSPIIPAPSIMKIEVLKRGVIKNAGGTYLKYVQAAIVGTKDTSRLIVYLRRSLSGNSPLYDLARSATATDGRVCLPAVIYNIQTYGEKGFPETIAGGFGGNNGEAITVLSAVR